MTTINKILEHPEIVDALADNEVLAMSYGIQNFDLSMAYWGRSIPSGADETLRKLQDRLAKLEQPTIEDTVTFVACACGHTVEQALVMSSSRGSSCPDCYDRMSD